MENVFSKGTEYEKKKISIGLKFETENGLDGLRIYHAIKKIMSFNIVFYNEK